MKKVNRIISMIACIFVIIGLTGCSSTEGIIGGKKIISIASTQPESHPIMIALNEFKDYIEENLGDKYEVKIYPNALMGQNGQALELVQMGTLDMVALSGSNMESYNSKYKIFGFPYIFNDEENFRKVMNNEEFINEIYNSTIDKGIQGVAWFANGVNNFYSQKKIEKPEDLKGLKIRVQSSQTNVKMVEAFDAAAVFIGYSELYTALQNHVIDVATNPEIALTSMKHGEVANYYIRTEHQIFTDLLVANTKFMNSLTPEEKEIFEKGFKLCTDIEVENWDKEIEKCIEEAEEMGVEFLVVDKSPFKEKQKSVTEDLLNLYPEIKPLYDKVQEIQKK